MLASKKPEHSLHTFIGWIEGMEWVFIKSRVVRGRAGKKQGGLFWGLWVRAWNSRAVMKSSVPNFLALSNPL
jgi:hypothetical protein